MFAIQAVETDQRIVATIAEDEVKAFLAADKQAAASGGRAPITDWNSVAAALILMELNGLPPYSFETIWPDGYRFMDEHNIAGVDISIDGGKKLATVTFHKTEASYEVGVTPQ